MKRKLLLIFSIIFVSILLTACGASVSSKIYLNPDGSGKVTVNATASYSDAEYIDGGYEALNEVIKNAAPEGLSLDITADDENSKYIYTYTIEFANADEYNSKLETLFGTKGDMTFSNDTTAFQSSVHFSNSTNKDIFVRWALDAIDEAELSSYNADEMMSWDYNYVYYNEQEQWYGSDFEDLDINQGMSVIRANEYTKYDENMAAWKRLELFFEPSEFATLDEATALTELSKFSSDFKIDKANSTLSIEWNDQVAMKTFFDKVLVAEADGDSSYAEESSFTSEVLNDSLFSRRYKLYENYSLDGFFNLFNMKSDTINTYLSVPDFTYSDNYFSPYSLAEQELPDYNYSGARYYDDWMTISFDSSQSVIVNGVDVKYNFNSDMSGTIATTLTFSKNGCDITEEKCKEFYKNTEKNITYQENGDEVTVVFTKDFSKNTIITEDKNILQMSKSDLSSLKNGVYTFDHIYDLSRYLPTNDIYITYKISIPDKLKLAVLNINGVAYNKNELKDFIQNGNYVISDSSYNSALNLSFSVEKTNPLYYLIILAAVLVVIAVIVVILLLLLKNKDTTPTTPKQPKQPKAKKQKKIPSQVPNMEQQAPMGQMPSMQYQASMGQLPSMQQQAPMGQMPSMQQQVPMEQIPNTK